MVKALWIDVSVHSWIFDSRIASPELRLYQILPNKPNRWQSEIVLFPPWNTNHSQGDPDCEPEASSLKCSPFAPTWHFFCCQKYVSILLALSLAPLGQDCKLVIHSRRQSVLQANRHQNIFIQSFSHFLMILSRRINEQSKTSLSHGSIRQGSLQYH